MIPLTKLRVMEDIESPTKGPAAAALRGKEQKAPASESNDAASPELKIRDANGECAMKRREALKLVAGTVTGLAMGAPTIAGPPRRKPNFIIVLCDDLGFGDIGVNGAKAIATPAIDRMAREGTILTDYYAPANMCTPSRAGLLTGRYPVRTGLNYVLMQNDTAGLPLSELTIAQALKPDYATALIGKWHLGHVGQAWPPTNHGFDLFYGIPYSHDMKPLALYESHAGSSATTRSDVDYPRLQQTFYEHAERFIEDNRDRPFFLELALSAPHLPEHPRPPFEGASRAGAYGDVVQEIDSIMDRLLRKLAALGLERDTLVIFTSDNGPWFEGSSGGLRERKGGGGYEGGFRVPFIAWQPGVVPAGRTVSSIAMGTDLLPTFCNLAGKAVPAGIVLDGADISTVLKAGAASPHDELLLFDNDEVVGIRTQRWKYVAKGYFRGFLMPYVQYGYDDLLFDLSIDPSESYSVAENHPDVVAEMRDRLKRAQERFAPFRHKPAAPPAKKAD
jgi:arylsulfatase A